MDPSIDFFGTNKKVDHIVPRTTVQPEGRIFYLSNCGIYLIYPDVVSIRETMRKISWYNGSITKLKRKEKDNCPCFCGLSLVMLPFVVYWRSDITTFFFNDEHSMYSILQSMKADPFCFATSQQRSISATSRF